jgi:hypothetical protein
MKRLLVIVGLSMLVLQGCGSPQKPSIPTVGQITSASVGLGAPGPSNDVLRLSPTNAKSKATLKSIVTWLNESKVVKLENAHRLIPSIGPTTLAIDLKDGKQILIQPAINSVTKHDGSKTIQTGRFAKGFIDFQYADSTKTFRLQSTPLDSWLLSNPWKTN